MADHTEAEKSEIEGGKKADIFGSQTANKSADERLKSITIFKVNRGLRESNPAAYTPKSISIGPYHNKSPELCSMEKYKRLYQQRFFNRKEGIVKESCMRELEKLKDEARLCYDDAENLHKYVEKFSEIMLLDGCFLVEFIRERFGIWPRGEHCQKIIIDKAWMIYQVCRDMVVLENQLPFFVLTMLYDMTKYSDEESFLYMVTRTLLSVSPKMTYSPPYVVDHLPFYHLLHVVHTVSSPLEMYYSSQGTDAREKKGFCNINLFFGKCLLIMNRSKEKSNIPNSWDSSSTPNATELYEAGVRFEKIGSLYDNRDTTTLLHIRFENRLLEIPCFTVDESTETFLRNMIAFEVHSSNVKPYFLSYARIMSQLIKSRKDVQLLRENGIILNRLSDDNVVANIFNRLSDEVVTRCGEFYYIEQCNKLSQHCQNPWNKMMAYGRKMMASLRDNYFFSPWAGASTVGAIILLVLTTIQTVLAFSGGIR